MVWSNDPGWVNRGKEYGDVNLLDRSAAIWGVDGVHVGPDYGRSQQPHLLAFRLILIVHRGA